MVGYVSCLIREIWLIAHYPEVGIGPGKVSVELPKLLYEPVSAQITITFGVKLYSRDKGGMYVCCVWQNHPTKKLYTYTVYLNVTVINNRVMTFTNSLKSNP